MSGWDHFSDKHRIYNAERGGRISLCTFGMTFEFFHLYKCARYFKIKCQMSALPFCDKMIHIHLMGTSALYGFIFIVRKVFRDKSSKFVQQRI